MTVRLALALLVAAAGTAAAAGCGSGTTHATVPGGDAGSGKRLIEYYGCGACHVIGGIATANGHVGPSLRHLRERPTIVRGKLRNTTANLLRWIDHPQRIAPGSDMPELGLSLAQIRDVVAYLYSQ